MVVEVGVRDEKEKQKAMKAVSGLSGIDSISMDMKEKKLTVIGNVDPIEIVNKLRKTWHTVIVSVGPPKEPEKPKEGGDKKEAPAATAAGGGGGEKKITEAEQIAELVKLYQNYNPYMTQPYVVHSIEENPNSCVIC